MKKFVDPSGNPCYILLLIVLMLPCTGLFAQTLQGTLYDAKTGEPIPYASVGIKYKSKGGIADRNGAYAIDISGIASSDSVIFSHIGYTTLAFRLSDINVAGKMDVKLVPREQSLATVTVSAQREMLTLGSERATSRFTGWGDYQSSRGRTRGLQLDVSGAPFKVLAFACRIKEMSFDSVKVRLNILGKVKGEDQLQQLLQRPVYFNIYKGAKWVNVDLTPYNIILSDTVVLAVEWVDSWAPPKKPREESNQFTIALSKDHGYFYERNTPNERPVLRQSMELPVMYLKGYKVGNEGK
ncbi:carboxypeptidase-like regulatory domain-containing protein [Chitinophaga rhizophila]|uniref:Carboxypeptidase-like regulatory domain-containing protein n=1 Tax=Chitinophaga rhizophila TaxID=2866212 RepID=A0ABS7GHR2_9BACT|nr:carboxypeptidase-like regulatory domain-containing protein [Chitinophaga rhizophila]MBW8686008.1 carboxypeptidase-like regulatory domain-containing protein [Chitinophaga rhizophila]